MTNTVDTYSHAAPPSNVNALYMYMFTLKVQFLAPASQHRMGKFTYSSGITPVNHLFTLYLIFFISSVEFKNHYVHKTSFFVSEYSQSKSTCRLHKFPYTETTAYKTRFIYGCHETHPVAFVCCSSPDLPLFLYICVKPSKH